MRLTCLILATTGLVTSANAEFVMVSPPAAEIDARDPAPALAANSRPKSMSPTLRRPAPQPVVAGFGDQVPLSSPFARSFRPAFRSPSAKRSIATLLSTGKAASPGAPPFRTLSARSVSPFPWSAPRS